MLINVKTCLVYLVFYVNIELFHFRKDDNLSNNKSPNSGRHKFFFERNEQKEKKY